MPRAKEPRLELQFNVPVWVSFQYDEPKVVSGTNGDSFMFGSVLPDGGQKSVWFAPNEQVANLVKDALGKCRLNNLPRRLALMKFQIGTSRRHFYAIGLPSGAGIIAAPKDYTNEFGQSVATVIPELFYEFYRKDTGAPVPAVNAPMTERIGIQPVDADKREQLDAMLAELGVIIDGVQSHWELMVEKKFWDMVNAQRIQMGQSLGDMTEADTNDARRLLATEIYNATKEAYKEMSGNVATIFIQRSMGGRWK